MNKITHFFWLGLIVIGGLGVLSCIDRGSPVFKSIENSAERRQTESTEKLISQSVALQRLEDVCKNLPIFKEKKPYVKSISKGNDELFLDYRIEQNFAQIKETVSQKLVEDGWITKKIESGFWEDQIEFEKEQ